jgi:hypothetical protein
MKRPLAKKRQPKTVVHVHRQRLAACARGGGDPPIIARTYKGPTHGHVFVLKDPDTGQEVGRFVHAGGPGPGRPARPLACGARVWFETRSLKVEVLA